MKTRKTTNIKSVPTTDSKEIKRGYNEKNPTEPQGAFSPDSSSGPKKAPLKKGKGKL